MKSVGLQGSCRRQYEFAKLLANQWKLEMEAAVIVGH